MQLFGGFCEAKRFRNADEVAQMTKFHRGKRRYRKPTRHVNAKKKLRIMTDRSATGRRAILKKYDVLPRTYWPGNERSG